MDLYLDPQTGDLDVSDTGVVRLTNGVPESAAQRLLVTLRMFTGEWFLDLRAGVPYYQSILVKAPDLDLVRSVFRQVIAADPFVVDVPIVDVALDRATRVLTLSFTARLREGSELEILVAQGIVAGGLVIQSVQVVINGVPVVLGGA